MDFHYRIIISLALAPKTNLIGQYIYRPAVRGGETASYIYALTRSAFNYNIFYTLLSITLFLLKAEYNQY
jgi:hypothetical protein